MRNCEKLLYMGMEVRKNSLTFHLDLLVSHLPVKQG